MQQNTTKLSIKLFGNFELTRDGEAIADNNWPSRKARQLLQILVSDKNVIWSKDQLIDELFPELDPDKAKKSLQARVSELRYVLEPDLQKGTDSSFIQTTVEGYTFDTLAPCEVDVESFCSQIEKGRQNFEIAKPQEALAFYQKALHVYRGDFLAEDPYSDWTQPLRQKFTSMHLDTLVSAAECCLEVGDPSQASHLAKRAQDLDPTREDACRAAMQGAFLLGNVSRIHQAYETCVNALAEAFNAEPSTETISLFQKLASNNGRVHKPEVSSTTSPSKSADAIKGSKVSRLMSPARIIIALTAIAIIAYSIVISTGLTSDSHEFNPLRVAVLPFRNMSENPETVEPFVEGIHEQLISTLSRVRDLEVIAATSVLRFKDTDIPISEIAEDLGAGTVIESSVRVFGEKLRVTVQVIDSSNEAHLWSQDYDREFSMHEIIEMQTDMALNVAASLNVTLIGQQMTSISEPPTDSLQAYNLYLEGMHFQRLKGKDNFERALESYEQAIALDPQFAVAYARLALAYINVGPNDNFSIDMLTEKVYALLDKAFQLDDELSDAHMVLSFVQNRVENDYDAARRSLEMALLHDPKNSQAINWYAAHLALVENDYAKAIETLEKALIVDPLNHSVYNNLAVFSWAIGRVEDSAYYYQKRLEYAENVGTRWKLALSLTQLYRWDEALSELERAREIHAENDAVLIQYANVLSKLGQNEKANELIAESKNLELSSAGSAALEEWYRLNRDYDALIQQAVITYSRDSRYVPSLVRKARGQMYLEEFDTAISSVEDAILLHSSGGGVETLIEARGAAGLIYARMGDRTRAEEQLQILRDWDDPVRQNRFTLMAHIEFELGNIDEAFNLLDRAYELNEARLTAIQQEPVLDEFRLDSRYLSLLEKMNLKV